MKRPKAKPAVEILPEATDQPEHPRKKISSFFFAEDNGNEPVKKFLRGLTKEERQKIGADIRTTEYGWPIGMPTCRNLGDGLHEVRTNLTNRIARILFRVDKTQKMVLLQGLIKKTEETPQADKDLANKRWSQYEEVMKNGR